jgi:hypothetical protein
MRKVFASSLVLGLMSVCSSPAWAVDATPATAAPAGAKPADAAGATPDAAKPDAPAEGEKPAASTAPDKDSSMVADAEAGSSPVELPGKTYLFVGARYRAIIVPKFMMNLFGSGGKTLLVHAAGPEFAIRKNAFEYNLSIWFASYSMGDTPFKAKNDDANAWEIVNSNLKSLFISSDFMWSQDFSPELALNYGLAGGFGIIFGNLYRNQAEPPKTGSFDTNTGEGFVPCATRGSNAYCDDSNDHYNHHAEPSWANGGSKPIIFPWFVLQTGLRYKPHRNFVARLDAGFGTSGFFLGLGVDYGL